jgi:fructose-1,6-bisphosphatase I
MRQPKEPSDIITVAQHIIEQQGKHPTASGGFSWLLSGITLATKIIAANVRRAGIRDVLGSTGQENVQGEIVQKLDTLANETLHHCLGYRGNVGIIASEENEHPRVIKRSGTGGKYVVVFDPLDGSSNIDVNVSTGTIFSILKRNPEISFDRDPEQDVLQPGTHQLAAGYVVYGSSCVLCYTTGAGVHQFVLDPAIGAFVLTRENVIMPPKGSSYSVNEGYRASFPQGYQNYLDYVKTPEAGPYSLRYIGSLVADFHRTLLRGGVFLYPPTAKTPEGKLRLMYEASPMAFLAEQAGGMATDGRGRILNKVPASVHERTPLVIGSREEVERVHTFLNN